MRRIKMLIAAVTTALMMSASLPAYASSLPEAIDSGLGSIDFSEMDELSGSFSIDGSTVSENVRRIIQGEPAFDIYGIFGNIAELFGKDVLWAFGALMQVFATGLICSVLKRLYSGRMSAAAEYVCFLFAALTAANMAVSLIGGAGTAIENMSSFMQAVFPPLLAFTAASGSAASAGVFQPAAVLLSGSIAAVLKSAVMPLITALTALSAVNRINSGINLIKLEKLLASCVKWGLGLMLTLFTGLLAVQGMVSATFDGITMKTARFTIDSMVPVVGSMVSDSADMMMSCSLLIKNSLGFAGIAAVFSMALAPSVKMAAVIIASKLLSALLEPLGTEKLAGCLTALADALTLAALTMLCFGMMFIITAAIMTASGSTALGLL